MEWQDSLRYKLSNSILKRLASAMLKAGKSNRIRRV
ncbi:uncharacterized protein METZ01_LOCUS141931 [marine metagenome]|uniref:Uncharacterized protein n=1 Tax=marine metagenome TaxID=408172 RepID=A0A381ZK11_9ZZZZ